MRIFKKGLLLILLITSLISCAVYQNNDVGKVAGTVGGGLLGSAIGQGSGRLLAVGSGMVVGYIVGNAIGNMSDNPLIRKLNTTLYYNLPNQSSCWKDSDGTYYILTPTTDLMAINDIPACRRYRMTVIKKQVVCEEKGIVCLKPDETWAVLVSTTVPGKGRYRDLVKYDAIYDVLRTTSPERQPVPSIVELQRY